MPEGRIFQAHRPGKGQAVSLLSRSLQDGRSHMTMPCRKGDGLVWVVRCLKEGAGSGQKWRGYGRM